MLFLVVISLAKIRKFRQQFQWYSFENFIGNFSGCFLIIFFFFVLLFYDSSYEKTFGNWFGNYISLDNIFLECLEIISYLVLGISSVIPFGIPTAVPLKTPGICSTICFRTWVDISLRIIFFGNFLEKLFDNLFRTLSSITLEPCRVLFENFLIWISLKIPAAFLLEVSLTFYWKITR